METLEAVAHQLQGAFRGEQVEAGVQGEEFLDHPHRQPVEVVQGFIFLGQVEEGLEGVVFQPVEVILIKSLPLLPDPIHDFF